MPYVPNYFLITLEITTGVLIGLLFLIILKTYAIEELIAWIKKQQLLIIDKKFKRDIVLAKTDSNGVARTKKDGWYRISDNSLKVTSKGFVIGMALPESAIVASPEIAAATEKMSEEGIQTITNTAFIDQDGNIKKIKGLEDLTFKHNGKEYFKHHGIVVSFEKVKDFMSGLTANLLESLVQREVIKEMYYKRKLDMKLIFWAVIIIGIIFIIYIIITKFTPAQHAITQTLTNNITQTLTG